MRPKLPDNEKRKARLIIRVNEEEKLRIKALTKSGRYGCMSDYIRFRIFKRLDKKVISLDHNISQQLRELDYELNKIGINLNQISKRMNSFSGYNIDDKDRLLLRHAFKMMTQCLAFLQNHLK